MRTRLVLAAVGAGVLLGGILAILSDTFRPADTGIADLDVLVLDDGAVAGSAYVIELELSRGGYPVVMHVDGDGLPSLLFPFTEPVRLGPGQRVRLPDPHGAATWRTDPRGGCLLVAVSPDDPPSTDRLVELAERAAVRARDARDAREQVRQVMRSRLGPSVLAELPSTGRAQG